MIYDFKKRWFIGHSVDRSYAKANELYGNEESDLRNANHWFPLAAPGLLLVLSGARPQTLDEPP